MINLISKCDGWQDDYEGDGRRFYTDGPHVHAYIKELTRDTGLDEMITVGEMNSTSLDQCKLYANPAEKELSMCFQFHHLKVDYKDGDKWKLQRPDIPKLKDILKTWQEEMQRAGSNMAVFWDNHDQPRAVSRFGSEDKYWKESAKMLAMCIHFMRGTPYIYQGDEIGMQNPHFSSIEQYRDVESIRNYEKLLEEGNRKEDILKVLAERSRDNGRTPMQWEKNGGFTKGSPWIGYGDSVSDINVAAQENEEDSILNFYRKMVQYRKNRKIIREGEISFQDCGEKVLAYERILGKEKLFVLCNFSENPSEQIVLPEEETGWTILEDSYTERNHFPERNVLILRPYEGIVLESREKI